MKARTPLVVLIASMLTVAGACSSSNEDASTASSSTSTSSSSSLSGSASTATQLRGKRYCEVLLVTLNEGNASAEVFNSYSLNDCPADQWQALDASTIATENQVPLAVLNGPRYWLMDSIDKANAGDRVIKTFGAIDMIRQANVEVGPIATALTPYLPHAVNRATVFTFDAGSTVYELTAADGSRYVMQTWSQQKDPSLAEADLAGLGPRLQLPAGWTYSSRRLDAPLRVVTLTTPAHVLMDDLQNSYSLETS